MRAAALAASGLVVAVLVLRRCYAVVTVSGVSMRPAFVGGERVLTRRCRHAIARGAVVVAEVPSPDPAWGWPLPPCGRDVGRRRWMVKRVVAVEGDPTPVRFADAAGVPAGAAVPPGHVLLAGDNVGASFDSHMFGYVPAQRLLGSVVRVVSS